MLRRVPTRDDVRVAFDHYLSHAMKGNGVPDDTPLDAPTTESLNNIARMVARNQEPTSLQLASVKRNHQMQLRAMKEQT